MRRQEGRAQPTATPDPQLEARVEEHLPLLQYQKNHESEQEAKGTHNNYDQKNNKAQSSSTVEELLLPLLKSIFMRVETTRRPCSKILHEYLLWRTTQQPC